MLKELCWQLGAGDLGGKKKEVLKQEAHCTHFPSHNQNNTEWISILGTMFVSLENWRDILGVTNRETLFNSIWRHMFKFHVTDVSL